MNLYTFFDLLALPLWIFLIYDGLKDILIDKRQWRAWVRASIGIVGFIADFSFSIFDPASLI